MLQNETVYLMAMATFAIAYAYGRGESNGKKFVRNKIQQALEQNEKDIKAGYVDGYNNVSLADRIRNIL
jgi:hypothetical protein